MDRQADRWTVQVKGSIERTDVWMDGWIDRQVNRWIVRRYGWTVRVDGWVDVIYKQVDLMIDRWMDG